MLLELKNCTWENGSPIWMRRFKVRGLMPFFGRMVPETTYYSRALTMDMTLEEADGQAEAILAELESQGWTLVIVKEIGWEGE